MNIALVFSMGTDVESIVSNPIGQPMATVRNVFYALFDMLNLGYVKILFNSLGTKGTLAIFSCIAIVQFMMGTEAVCLLSTFLLPNDYL